MPPMTALQLFSTRFTKKGEATKNADYLFRASLQETINDDSEYKAYIQSIEQISTLNVNYK